MINIRAYREGLPVDGPFRPEGISDLLEDGSLVWVDVEDPSEDEIRVCAEEFELHPESLNDLRERNQRTKVDQYGEYFQVVVYAVEGTPEALIDKEIHLYASARFVLSFRFTPAFPIDRILQRWEAVPEVAAKGGGALLHMLLDEIVDTYFPVIQAFDDASDDLEDRVFSTKVEAGLQEEIFRLKKTLVDFRRHIVPLRDVLDFLEEDQTIIGADIKPYFRDVFDSVYRAMEFVDNSRETMTAALGAYQAAVGNQMNQIMKKLTSWAAILLVPTLIAGIYGMNFEHMPELDWTYGYPMALGLMVVICGVLYIQFHKRDWL
ncbi:MAG: magnesium/cobalt transporter CorA [Actinobacteria bacterium]|nr:magnesium/cobalt transporter CorA [Actinomycetota bacterium]